MIEQNVYNFLLINITFLLLGSSSNHKRVINKEQVKYLHGNNVERIFIQCVRLCNELKNCLDEFKVEQSKYKIVK